MYEVRNPSTKLFTRNYENVVVPPNRAFNLNLVVLKRLPLLAHACVTTRFSRLLFTFFCSQRNKEKKCNGTVRRRGTFHLLVPYQRFPITIPDAFLSISPYLPYHCASRDERARDWVSLYLASFFPRTSREFETSRLSRRFYNSTIFALAKPEPEFFPPDRVERAQRCRARAVIRCRGQSRGYRKLTGAIVNQLVAAHAALADGQIHLRPVKFTFAEYA